MALGINPAYQMPLVDLTGVNVVAIADREDETASSAKVALPVSHYLESWSDFSATDGHYAVGQPTISPLFDSKSAVEIVNALAGGSESAKALIEASASANSGSISWNALLHDGFVLLLLLKSA